MQHETRKTDRQLDNYPRFSRFLSQEPISHLSRISHFPCALLIPKRQPDSPQWNSTNEKQERRLGCTPAGGGMDEETKQQDNNNDRPIVCALDSQRCKFRVLRAKGKALSSGGFGVSIAETSTESEGDTADGEGVVDDECECFDHGLEETGESIVQPMSKKSTEFLFIEETLFLHERGLLLALSGAEGDALDTSQLYQLLPELGVSLAIYLVYSHLRSQEYRVLRHDPNRLPILQLQQQQKQLEGTSGAKDTSLRRQVKESIQHAPPPYIPADQHRDSSNNNNNNSHPSNIQICWDVYNPNCNFGKTHPGLPDFFVAVGYYNVPLIRFSELQYLIKGPCQGIPLKVATVSDSGTVVMFGVTDYGIPKLKSNREDAEGEKGK